MKSRVSCAALAASLLCLIGPTVAICADEDVGPLATAILPFTEKGSGAEGMGTKVGDILFAVLVAEPDLNLVDREDFGKTLSEAELNASGAVNPAQATQIGQLTGAKLLVTGSVVQTDNTLYLVAKVIGTETSRVSGASIKGTTNDEFSTLVEQLGAKIADAIRKDSDKLVAKVSTKEDAIATLSAKLKDSQRPSVWINVSERHLGQPSIDPAAQTEVAYFCKETGFEVVDGDKGNKGKADILITGEGFSEFGGRLKNLVSVKARVELKAVERETGKVLAVDRQTEMAVDLTEQVAGKAALQKAAARLAERMLPKLVSKE